jgi:hypothetical protein
LPSELFNHVGKQLLLKAVSDPMFRNRSTRDGSITPSHVTALAGEAGRTAWSARLGSC